MYPDEQERKTHLYLGDSETKGWVEPIGGEALSWSLAYGGISGWVSKGLMAQPNGWAAKKLINA